MSENPYLDALRRTASTTGAQQPAVPAGPAANPYLETLQTQRAAENAALNGQLSQAVRVNPDQFARQRSVAQMMGYPTAAVEALPELEQQAKVDRIRSDIAGSPALQRAYTDADFARLAQDDSGVLSQIGQFVRNLGGSTKAGLYTASRGAAGTFQAGLDLLAPALDIFENPSASVSPNRAPVPFVAALPGGNPLRRLSETFAVLGGGADTIAKAARPKTEGILAGGFFSGIESLTQNLLALPMAFAPGGQGAALTMMTAGTGGNAYQDAREKGLPMSQALPFAASQAAIEYATEKLPLGALLKDVKAGTGFLRTLGRQIALEIPGEQVATVLQDLNEWAVLNPEKPFSSYLEARPSAAAQTLVATIVGAGGNVAVVKGIEAVMSRAVRDGTDMEQATQTSQALGAALKGAEASALLKRDPSQFRDVMNALAEDGVVYVDAQVLAQMPPDVLAQMEGVQAELPDALATSSPVAVKVADILTLAPGTPLAETFTQNARRTPDSPTLVETEEAGKVAGEFLKNEFDRVLAQAADTAAWQQGTQTVQQTILGELNTAGRFTPDVNEAYATLQANFFSTMAARVGMTPEALYERYRLRVAARQPGGGGQVLNAEQTLPPENLRNLATWSGSEGIGPASEMVRVYRAVPKGSDQTAIRPGDWVTANRDYLADYAGPDATIIESTIPANELVDAQTGALARDTLVWTPFNAPEPNAEQTLRTVQAGDVVDGRVVRDGVPNLDAIGASLDNYEVLPGVREVPMSAFDPEYVAGISMDRLDERTRALAEEIRASNEITPLIVVQDADGMYVLEGGHRFDALIASGAQSLPAVVVIDQDNPPGQVLNQPAVDRLQMVAERGVRETANRSVISADERTAIEASSKETGVPVADIEAAVRRTKLAHPVAQGWEPLTYNRTVVEGTGEDRKVSHEYKAVGYSFSTDAEGKSLEPGTANYTRRVNAVARSMVDEVRSVFRRAAQGDANARNILAQAGWYKAMRARLRQEFGGMGDLFADLLGATSPNTPVRDNWFNAVDALRRASRGDFDTLIVQWEAYFDNVDALETDLRAWFNGELAEGKTKKAIKASDEYQTKIAALRAARVFPDALLPKKESGAKYGFNGRNVARAMVDLWRVVKNADPDIARGGTAPKALNFSGNLIGFRQRATIDVWAARMLQRLAGRRRVPSVAETGVSGDMREDGNTTLQFGFGQDVFGKAARDIRADTELNTDPVLAEVNDDDLQAVVWFIEKEVWTVNDWTSAAGEGGSFELEANLSGTSEQARVKQLRSIIDGSPPSADVVAAGQDTSAALKAIENHEREHAAEIEELRKLQTGETPAYKGYKKRMGELGKIARPPKEATALLGQVERAKARLEAFNARKAAAKIELASLEREVDRFTGGLSIQMSRDTQGVDFVPTDADMARLAETIRQAVYETDNGSTVLGAKALSTEGRYGGVERSLDLEVVAREGYDANALWLRMLREAQEARQDSTFLSRVLRANEDVDLLRHRPGVEIYFRDAASAQQLETVLADLAKEGVEFLTVIVDGRRLASTIGGEMPAAVGVRLQYVPEFEQRYGMDDLAGLDDVALAAKIKAKADELDNLAARVLASVDGVSFADQFWYDTQVAFSADYREKINALTTGTAEGQAANAGSQVWAGQPIRAGLESAARQVRETASGQPGGKLLSGDARGTDAGTDTGVLEQSSGRRPSVNTLLRRSGQQVQDSVDAARRWNDGERIFAYAEQDARPVEVTSAAMLENYTADQLLALPKEVLEQPGRLKLGSSQGFKTGRPVRAEVYHGSDRPIADFDPAKLGDNTGAASAAEGFFFAGKESTSQRYVRANLESVTITPDMVAGMPREDLAQLIAEWSRQSMADFAYDWINDVLVDSVPGTASIVNTEVDDNGNYERGSLSEWVRGAPQEAVEALVEAINGNSPNFPLTTDPSVEDGGSESMGSVGRYIVDLQNPFVYDFKGERYRDVSYAEIIRQAKADGHDGVILMNTFDPGPEVDNVFVVFDAGQIRYDELAFGDGFSQEQPAQPGPRGTYNPETLLITLGETADLSTFLHESGHFFLEVLAELASQPNAPAGIAADMKSTLKWFGVKDLATWNAMTLDQKRPYHEKWAESFEQYLFEGKAPTAELQPLFRRFRSWMLNVYKSLSRFMTGRNLQVNDEVRQVFDRMLATDEQIAQAEQAAGMLPDFKATNEAIEALQARSLRDLKWTVRARGRALKALEKQAADLRKGVEAEVRAEVGQEPVYRAIRWLRTGEMTDEEGTLVKAEKGFRLNTDAIAEMYPESMLARPDLTGLKGMTSKTGLSPDLVADMFGYPSGDALVRAVLAAEPMGSVIEGITDQRMLERHGELATPEALEAAANEAVHNEARARSLATELKSQSEMMNERRDTGRTNAAGRPITVNTIVEAAKQFALNLVARRRVNDLKSAAWQHRSAEARAGRRWQEATAKGETAKAVQAKRDQLLNNYAAKALQEAEAEVRKIGEFFKRVTTGNNEKVVKGGRDPDVVNAMRAILAAYGVAPRLQKSALEYMDAVSRNDPAMYAALKPSVDGAMMAARPLGEMTMEELRGLNDELRAMWALAKRSRQMEVDGNLMDIEDAAADLVDRMGTIGIPAEIPGEKGAITDKQERGIKLRFALSILTRVEQWAERLDGKYGGPFLRLVFQPIKDAADRFRTDRVDYRKRYEALLKDVAPYLPRGAIAAPELGYTFGNARDSGAAELMHAILHTGNDSNKRKLLLGRGWATENADGTLDTTAWDTFLQRMAAEGKLVKQHYDFAQGVWDLLEQMKPLAQETHRQVYGRYFAEVTANEVVTPFGTYRGGYVPAQTDARLVKDAKLRELAEGENESMAYAFPASPSGFTKSRVEYNKPLMLDLRTLAQHMDKVLLFSHMQGAVTDVRRLLANKSVSYALDRIDPGAYEGMLIPWLNRAARQVVETPVMGDRKISRLLSAGRSRAGMALMFANLSNTFQQITGFSMAAVKVKPGLMMKATAQFIADPKAMKTAVAEASPFMKDRMLNEVSALNDAVEQILLDPTMLERGQAWTQRHAYFMQAAVDNTMSPIIWTAAYNQAIAKGETERDAIRFADGTIRQTQGSTLPEDISRFESGPAYGRLFTQFVSYFNMMANTNFTAVSQIAGEMGLRKGAGKVLYVALIGLLVPIWVAEAIAHAFRGGPEDEDDDGYLDDWLMAVFGLGTIRGMVAQVPIVGQAAQLVVNRFNDNPADDKFSLSPAVSLIESTVSAPSSVYKAIVEDGNKQKAVRDVAAAATMITGLPIFALGRPLGYIAGMADDRIEPTGPADIMRGLVTGTASPESKVP